MKITLSAIKADIGSIGGHTRPSKEVLDAVENYVKSYKSNNLLLDCYVEYAGDDIDVLMSHTNGVNYEPIHKLVYEAFKKGTEIAKSQGLYGAGQDLLVEAFSGNVRGMGPGVAEMEFEERPAENFILFAADKTEPGAFNFPLYRTFCNPLSNTGNFINPSILDGVKITVMDVMKNRVVELYTWEDIPYIATILMYPGRYVIESVHLKGSNEPVVVATTDRLHNIAGKYVGKDDPAMIVRVQKNFPATEEVCAAFNKAHYVAGNTRGSHHLPLMPVSINSPASTNYCIPIVSSALFSMKNGKFVEPVDGFGDKSWDGVREKALIKAELMREQGFFHPATLIPEELEYIDGYKKAMERIEKRFIQR